MTVDTHHVRQLTPEQVAPPASIDVMRRRWIGVGVFFLIFALGWLVFKRNEPNVAQEFMRAYLVGYMFCFNRQTDKTLCGHDG